MENIPSNPILASFIRAKHEAYYLSADPITGLIYLNENLYLNLGKFSTLDKNLLLGRNYVKYQKGRIIEQKNPLPACMEKTGDLLNEINRASKIIMTRKGYFPSSTLTLTLPESIEKPKPVVQKKPYNAADFFSTVNIRSSVIPVIKHKKDVNVSSLLHNPPLSSSPLSSLSSPSASSSSPSASSSSPSASSSPSPSASSSSSSAVTSSPSSFFSSSSTSSSSPSSLNSTEVSVEKMVDDVK